MLQEEDEDDDSDDDDYMLKVAEQYGALPPSRPAAGEDRDTGGGSSARAAREAARRSSGLMSTSVWQRVMEEQSMEVSGDSADQGNQHFSLGALQAVCLHTCVGPQSQLLKMALLHSRRGWIIS